MEPIEQLRELEISKALVTVQEIYVEPQVCETCRNFRDSVVFPDKCAKFRLAKRVESCRENKFWGWETNQKPNVKLGDIFYESWGYEQTNIDFAKVVGFTKSGKSAICRMMSETIHSTEGLAPMSENVIPDKEYGPEFKLRIRTGTNASEPCLLGSYPFCDRGRRFGYFYPWNGQPIYQSHYA